jgi:hypothetical protein
MLLDQHIQGLRGGPSPGCFWRWKNTMIRRWHCIDASGFAKVGERPGYYAKPDGSRALALILRRDIG